MEFNEEKAKEIVERYNLSDNTVGVWRNRNRIPDKYSDENYQPTPEVGKADKIILARIKELKEKDCINFSTLAELAGMDTQRLYDAVKGKGRIRKDELDKVVMELKKLKVFINNHLQNSPGKLKRLFENKLLKFYVINGKDEWSKSVYYAISKENQLSQHDFMRLKDNYIKTYIMLNI